MLASLISFLTAFLISCFVSFVGKSMSWYNRPIWILFLYIMPSISAFTAVQYYLSKNFTRVSCENFPFPFPRIYYYYYNCILSGDKIQNGYFSNVFWCLSIFMDNGSINNNYITCEIRLHRLDVGNRSLFGYFNPQINCVPSGKRFVIFPIPTPPQKKTNGNDGHFFILSQDQIGNGFRTYS